ncbi:MAG TPA: fumarylacetoacetate hydrolase family protein [Streptosporangiaceae bacterium]|jgi:acylpyruvate hydrolase
MRLVTYERSGSARSGVVADDSVVDLQRAYTRLLAGDGVPAAARRAAALLPLDLRELLEGGADSLEAARRVAASAQGDGLARLREAGAALPLDDVRLAPPVRRPEKIICLGRNYRAHAEEGGGSVPAAPELFAVFANTLIGHRAPIVLPRVSTRIDYEAELAVVIGSRARDVPADRALGHVAGYTILNDVTARDYQSKTSQWFQGKGLDTFSPTGPWLVTADEVPDPQSLRIRLAIGERVLQDAVTSEMIYPVAETIAYVSRLMTLEPGDIIATGTPEGVGNARKPPVYLRDGDTVRITIDAIGTLENPVTATPAAD